MKLLRLGNSQDVQGVDHPSQSISAQADTTFTRLTNEPIQTTTRTIWPSENLHEIVDRWMKREQPDAVFLCCTSFWVSYASVPLRIQRRLPTFGRPVAAASRATAARPRIAHNRLFRFMRSTGLRTIGGEYHFETDYAATVMERVARTILQREPTLLCLRGPVPHTMPSLPTAYNLASNQRVADFDARMAAFAERLHLPFHTFMDFDQLAHIHHFQGDELHLTPEGMAYRGDREGSFLAREWLKVAAQAPTATATP